MVSIKVYIMQLTSKEGMIVKKPVVAFVCTHNACRSQIAEALAKDLASDAFVSHSGGTHPAERINEDTSRLLTKEFGLSIASLRPKPLAKIPRADILVTMGCGVECPELPAAYREDWGLDDPTGKGDRAFLQTMRAIQQRVIGLRARIIAGEFDRERLASNLKTLGDANRLRIIELLWDGQDRCACSLLNELEISQPTLSHHMASLRDAGIVRARRDGRRMHYRLDHDVLDAIAALLGQSFSYCVPLDANRDALIDPGSRP